VLFGSLAGLGDMGERVVDGSLVCLPCPIERSHVDPLPVVSGPLLGAFLLLAPLRVACLPLLVAPRLVVFLPRRA
jgi:hypothetical protein